MTEEANENTQIDEQGGKNTVNAGGVEPKMFSQDDVNGMIKKKADELLSRTLNGLGLGSLDEVKSIVQAKREADESAKSELQRAMERADGLEKKLAEAAIAQKTLATQTEVANTATRLGIVDPDAAYKLLDKGAIEYGDNGKPVNVEVLLQGLLKDKPYLGGGGASPANPQKRRDGDGDDPMVVAMRKAANLK